MAGTKEQVLASESDLIDDLHVNEAWMRHSVYRFFASLHLYPDRDRLGILQKAALQLHGEGSSSVSTQFTGLNEYLGDMNETSIHKVEEEYVALFSVNPCAPPYESYYQDPEGFVRSWIIIQLEKEYAEAGLKIRRSFKQPPDHVAIELEFMAFLCSLEAKGHETSNEVDVRTSLERQYQFLSSHLGNWYPRFAQMVKDAPTMGLYDLTVEATNTYLHLEKSAVRTALV